MGGIDCLDRRVALLLVAAAALLLALVNPTGYSGAGDDGHYLDAARCWAAQGPCLPVDHWWSRWPIVAPMAAGIALLGQGRWGVEIAPFLAWVSALVLVGVIGRLWFDRATGLLAALLLASTPVVTFNALTPAIDLPELALQLAAVAAMTLALQLGDRRWAIAAGMAGGLAFAARETSLLFLGVGGLVLLASREGRRMLVPAIAGAFGVVAAEMFVYLLVTGDALFRFRLSFHHVAIPTAELPSDFDTSQKPLFNPTYIRSWRREAGIMLWWPIDPWLNLVAARMFAPIVLAALFAFIAWRRLAPDRFRVGARAVAAALLLSAGLVYALALDPKSRMFMGLAAALALLTAGLAVAAWRHGRRGSVMLLVGAVYAVAFLRMTDHPSIRRAEPVAASWIAAHRGNVEADPATLEMLKLVSGQAGIAPLGSGRGYRLAVANDGCGPLLASARGRYSLAGDAGGIGGGADLCLFRALP